jgi:hypothetical protein
MKNLKTSEWLSPHKDLEYSRVHEAFIHRREILQTPLALAEVLLFHVFRTKIGQATTQLHI